MMKTYSILHYIGLILCLFASDKILSQQMVSLPNGGCGRILDAHTASRSDGGFLCFRVGKEAANPSNMTDLT